MFPSEHATSQVMQRAGAAESFLPFIDRERELEYLKSFIENTSSRRIREFCLYLWRSKDRKESICRGNNEISEFKGLEISRRKNATGGQVFPYAPIVEFIRQISRTVSVQLF